MTQRSEPSEIISFTLHNFRAFGPYKESDGQLPIFHLKTESMALIHCHLEYPLIGLSTPKQSLFSDDKHFIKISNTWRQGQSMMMYGHSIAKVQANVRTMLGSNIEHGSYLSLGDGLRHFAYQKEQRFYNGVTLEQIHGESNLNGIHGRR